MAVATPRLTDERDCVRRLADQVAEIAAGPENRLIQQRWRDVNALRCADRAPVWCKPVGAWPELLPEEQLACHDPWRRSVERSLRMTLIKHDIGDDTPVDAGFPVPVVFDRDPPSIWGLPVHRLDSDDEGGAWGFDPALVTRADFDKLRLPHFRYNRARTERALERAAELLGDTLPVRRTCDAPLSATLGTAAADLRGLSELMLDMAAEPELVHRLMAHLRDGVLQAMREVEAAGVLTPNNSGPMLCSDPVGSEPADGGVTYRNLWVMANSQEFESVSPAMWEEFSLAYQLPIIEQFGLSAYGCCENLTRKIDGVLRIPNLRIFVCSAWTNLDTVIDRVGSDYVIMWRQKATDVIFTDDLSILQRGLDDGLRRLRGCYTQVVLRELQTLNGHLDRLHHWTRMAKAAAERFA